MGAAEFSRSALPAMLCQKAWLSTVPEIGNRVPLRLLGPMGTKKNKWRMQMAGYWPTGTRVFDIPDVEFMERFFTIRAKRLLDGVDAGMLGNWHRLQIDLREPEAEAWVATLETD